MLAEVIQGDGRVMNRKREPLDCLDDLRMVAARSQRHARACEALRGLVRLVPDLLEPTEGMVETARAECDFLTEEGVRAVWRAMLKAIGE